MSIRPDQISQASVDAAAEVLWNENGYITMEEARDMARAALAAALAAWPMMQYRAWDDVRGVGLYIHLPLQEPSE